MSYTGRHNTDIDTYKSTKFNTGYQRKGKQTILLNRLGVNPVRVSSVPNMTSVEMKSASKCTSFNTIIYKLIIEPISLHFRQKL